MNDQHETTVSITRFKPSSYLFGLLMLISCAKAESNSYDPIKGDELIQLIKGSAVRIVNNTKSNTAVERFNADHTYTRFFSEPYIGHEVGRYEIHSDRVCIVLKSATCFQIFEDYKGRVFRALPNSGSRRAFQEIDVVKEGEAK